MSSELRGRPALHPGDGLSLPAFGLLRYFQGREDAGAHGERRGGQLTFAGLAEAFGEEKKAIARALKELEAAGLVEISNIQGLGFKVRCRTRPRPAGALGGAPADQAGDVAGCGSSQS